MRKTSIFVLAFLVCGLLTVATAQEIYWGNSVPKGWNGTWPEKYLTVPEKTKFVETTSSLDVLKYIDVLRWNSENVGIINMFTSGLRKIGTAAVLANPRVASPEEAKASGKPVVYIQGNIHPPESECKEALLMLMRDILFGKKKYLLDNQIIIFCPNFNVDGNDTLGIHEGSDTPHLLGFRTNFQNLDLNRDALKLETPEVNGLYRNVIVPWDPVFLYDGHAMGRIDHGYAIVYANSTVPAAHPAPRGYVYETMEPALRQSVRDKFGLEIFTHCDFGYEDHTGLVTPPQTSGYENLSKKKKWPPTVWSHEAAIWTTEGKFIASSYGLRNRMSILAETPGHSNFERKIYAHYALVNEILEYTNTHGKEMMAICKKADEEVTAKVLAQAESGKLKNFIEGKYESWGKIDVLAYRKNEGSLIPGTSVPAQTSAEALGAPEVVHGVEHLTKPVGTKEATMPRGYLIPEEVGWLADKIRTLGVKVEVLDKPAKFTGEEFTVEKLVKVAYMQTGTSKITGSFATGVVKEFPAGTFKIDLSQPLGNLAFYALEPQISDSITGWGLLDNYLRSKGIGQRSVTYPVFKYLKSVE